MKKSILFFLALIVIYEVFIRNVDVWWTSGQNQWQANRITVNNFLFRTREYPNIMVGSSLAARLTAKVPKDSLPSDLYNLSLNGQSLFDGLLILKESGYVPRTLFIETNVITRDEDIQLQNSLFSPIAFNLKKYIRSWRDSYQPVELLFRFRTRKPTDADLVNQGQSPRDEKTFKAMLAVQLEKDNSPIAPDTLKNQITKLAGLISYFQKKGTQVVLFELPVDPAICSLPRTRQIRTAIKEAFEPMNCAFIDVPDCNNYRTTDGVHLEMPSVYVYLNYLRNTLDSGSMALSKAR